MKLWYVSYTLDDQGFIEFASSAANARKIRARVKKMKAVIDCNDEVEIESSHTALIAFLNSLTAHPSSSES